jgi:hypothetical protein
LADHGDPWFLPGPAPELRGLLEDQRDGLVQINREERDALWHQLINDLMGAGDLALVLSRGDEDAGRRLHERHIGDVRLLDHIGWQGDDHRDSFDLPVERDAGLADTMRRLGGLAAIALADAILDTDFSLLERLARTSQTCARATRARLAQH